MVFIQETKVRANYLLPKFSLFGFQNDIVVDCVGKGGGVALM